MGLSNMPVKEYFAIEPGADDYRAGEGNTIAIGYRLPLGVMETADLVQSGDIGADIVQHKGACIHLAQISAMAYSPHGHIREKLPGNG